MNLKPYPHWLCPEYMARKIGCRLQEAADLVDCWVILDLTHEMIETFISWVKARGVEKALAYFEKLAMALAEVENMDPDDVTESPEPAYDAPDLYRYHTVGEYEEVMILVYTPQLSPYHSHRKQTRCIMAGSPAWASQSLNSWNPGTPVCRAAHSTGRSKTDPSCSWTIASPPAPQPGSVTKPWLNWGIMWTA